MSLSTAIFIFLSIYFFVNDYCTDLNFEYSVQINANYKFDKFLNSSILLSLHIISNQKHPRCKKGVAKN